MEISYKDYEKHYTLRTKVLGLQDAKNKLTFRIVNKYIGGCKSVLDVGCGRGFYLVPLNRTERSVMGLDICSSNIELLNNHGYAAEKCDCVSDIPYNEEYESVLCAEVLEHLTRKECNKLLKNIYSALKKNGILVLTVPFKERIESNMVVCPHCEKQFHRDGHVRNYREINDFVAEVENNGFAHVGHKNVVTFPGCNHLPLFFHQVLYTFKKDLQSDMISKFVKID